MSSIASELTQCSTTVQDTSNDVHRCFSKQISTTDEAASKCGENCHGSSTPGITSSGLRLGIGSEWRCGRDRGNSQWTHGIWGTTSAGMVHVCFKGVDWCDALNRQNLVWRWRIATSVWRKILEGFAWNTGFSLGVHSGYHLPHPRFLDAWFPLNLPSPFHPWLMVQ